MDKINKLLASVKESMTLITAMFVIVTGATVGIWNFMDQKEKRDIARQEALSELEKERMADQISDLVAVLSAYLVTKKDFEIFVESQNKKMDALSTSIVEMASASDSTLILVLPQIIEEQRKTNNRLSGMEILLTDGSEKISESEKVWKYLREKEKSDSTAARHKEIMLYLKRINSDKMRAKFGDRAE